MEERKTRRSGREDIKVGDGAGVAIAANSFGFGLISCGDCIQEDCEVSLLPLRLGESPALICTWFWPGLVCVRVVKSIGYGRHQPGTGTAGNGHAGERANGLTGAKLHDSEMRGMPPCKRTRGTNRQHLITLRLPLSPPASDR